MNAHPIGSEYPRFSVVIPLFNKRHAVAAGLRSIREQTWPAYEVIVVDDGSTDGGDAVVAAEGQGWVTYIRQPNQGVAAARNSGIAIASGSHIAFLDADDTWMPTHLEAIRQLTVVDPHATIYGTGWIDDLTESRDLTLTDEPVRITLDRYLARAIANQPPFWTGAVAVPRESLELSGLFPAGSRIAEDQDAWITQLRKGHGLRTLAATAHYRADKLNPTIAAPKASDFESVIFTKWAQDPFFKQPMLREFVASHRLYTIRRHVGATNTLELLRKTWHTRTSLLWRTKLKVLALLVLNSLGLRSLKPVCTRLVSLTRR